MEREKIYNLISQMTLEEKAGMCSGADFWHLKGIERLGIPQVMVTDGLFSEFLFVIYFADTFFRN